MGRQLVLKAREDVSPRRDKGEEERPRESESRSPSRARVSLRASRNCRRRRYRHRENDDGRGGSEEEPCIPDRRSRLQRRESKRRVRLVQGPGNANGEARTDDKEEHWGQKEDQKDWDWELHGWKPKRERKAKMLPRADPEFRRVFFIGVAGPSGAGKTTLSRHLATEFDSPLAPIGLDWFLDPKRMPKDPKYGKNWETPEGVDFPALLADLKSVAATLSRAWSVPEELHVGPDGVERGNVVRNGQAGRKLTGDPAVVIVEGFLLFHDVAVCRLFDAHIWLDASYETCLGRRHKRGKGSRKRDVEELADWFHDLVWVNHTQNRDRQLDNAVGCLRVDGSEPKENVFDQASKHCQGLLSGWHEEGAPSTWRWDDNNGGRRGWHQEEGATEKGSWDACDKGWQEEGARDGTSCAGSLRRRKRRARTYERRERKR